MADTLPPTISIRPIHETRSEVLLKLKARDKKEKIKYKSLFDSFQALLHQQKDMKKSIIDYLPVAAETGGGVSVNKIELQELKEKNRVLQQKLIEARERVDQLMDGKDEVEVNAEGLQEMVESLQKDKDTLQKNCDQQKNVITELVEQLEIKSKEKNGVEAENEALTDKIKELQGDNALLFKKVCDLQQQQVDKMNEINKLYDQIKTNQVDTLQKKNMEEDTVVRKPFDLRGSIMDGYIKQNFKVPDTPLHTVTAHSKEAICVEFDTRGTMLATGGGDGLIKLWDFEKGQDLHHFNLKFPATCLGFSPDNDLMAGGAVNKQVKIWNLKTQRQQISFPGHTGNINDLKFSYTDKTLITGSSDRTIKTWDYYKGFCNKTYGCTSSCFTIDVVPNESLFVSGHLDGALRFWSGESEKKVHEIKDLHSDAISSVTILPGGKHILTNSRDHTLKLIDLNTYKVIDTFEHDSFLNPSNVNRACVSTNGKFGAVGSRNGTLVVFEITPHGFRFEEAYEDLHIESINSVRWQPDGPHMASVDASGMMIIWE